MDENENQSTFTWIAAFVSAMGLLSLLIFFLMDQAVDYTWATVLFLLSQAFVISIVIWQACDPFGDAAQYLGARYKLPGSVRGATLDAVASSLPELFTGIFFVVIAVTATDTTAEQLEAVGHEGFGATLATCAGSAIYNMILIPAICAIFISYYRPARPSIDIEDRVIARDGMWFVACEMVLIFFLFTTELHWWMGIILIGMYVVYVIVLYHDAKKYRALMTLIQSKVAEGHTLDDAVRQAWESGEKVSRDLVERLQRSQADDEVEESAGVVFGALKVRLNILNAWIVIGITTLVAAFACYWLVEVTRQMASALDVPVFFVAVIVAAAASSIPDTFLSIASARKGDDDGAVSNAFGSNIFDISICLSIPLIIGCYMNGWNPIPLTHDDAPIEGLFGLRIMLLCLTFVTLLMMWHNRQLTRKKAYILCGLYLVFVSYAVAGSMGWWS